MNKILLCAAAFAAEAAGARAFFTRTRFVDDSLASAEVLAVQGFDRLTRFGVVRHFDETEPLGAVGFTIGDDTGGGDIAERGEGLLEFVTIDAVRQVTNVDVHPSLLPFSTGFPSPAFPEQFFSHLPGCKLSLLFHPRRGRRTVGVMRGRAVGSRGLDGWLRILLT